MNMETLWPIIKPILAGQIRTYLAGFGAILVHSGAIEQGDMASFTKMGTGIAIWVMVAGWSWWQKVGQAKFVAIIAKMKPVAVPSATTGEAVKAATDAVAKVAAVLLAALILGALAFPGSASAQVKLKFPIDPLHLNTPTTGALVTPAKPGACDITLFANLSFASVVQDIQNCVGSVVSAGATPFVNDLSAALDSANTAKDGIAMACLTPALAIARAAQGTAAVTAADGTVTTPATYPGPILIFQKYREFVNAGGPSNCKTAVQSTINGTVASAL
jgi:hypothetical protein